ncbi:MAG: hypothetical protein KIT22_11140 [Verrucomicrobiae bacterium]|nr:hypothetical protein [Verrucomicrobiae bacterium]
MNTRTTAASLLLALATLAGCQSHGPRTREYTLILSSALPVTFTGTLRVDGKEQPVSGTTPAEYPLVAERIDCELVQGPEPGLLTVQIRQQGDPEFTQTVLSSQGPNSPLRGTARTHDFWAWLR